LKQLKNDAGATTLLQRVAHSASFAETRAAARRALGAAAASDAVPELAPCSGGAPQGQGAAAPAEGGGCTGSLAAAEVGPLPACGGAVDASRGEEREAGRAGNPVLSARPPPPPPPFSY